MPEERTVQAFGAIKEAPALAQEEADPRFTAVQDFMRRFGYLPGDTSVGLARFQEFFGLPVTGAFGAKAGSGDACQIR